MLIDIVGELRKSRKFDVSIILNFKKLFILFERLNWGRGRELEMVQYRCSRPDKYQWMYAHTL